LLPKPPQAPTAPPELFEGVDLGDLINFLRFHSGLLTPEQTDNLLNLAREVAKNGGNSAIFDQNTSFLGTGSRIGDDFDLAGEVSEQLLAVRALRKKIYANGIIIGDLKEAKDVLTAGNQMLQLLVKLEGEVRTIERLRAVETAVIEVLKDESPELRESLLRKMEERLGLKER
jgi:hypothetical protein